MKKLISLMFTIGVVIFLSSSAGAQTDNQATGALNVQTPKVQVYYFHGDRRCETCKAVGKVSQELVQNKFKDNKNVEFVEINYDEAGNEALEEKFEVTSSGLYVYNQKDIVNLTTFAFQYAKTDPKKLEEKLLEVINKDLN